MNPFVLGLAGQQYSGKSTLAKYLMARYDARIWSASSDLFREIVDERGLPQERASYSLVSEDFRDRNGEGALIDAMLAQFPRGLPRFLIHDGLRWPGAVMRMRERIPGCKLMYLDSTDQLRFRRSLGQGKNGRAAITCLEDFLEEEALASEQEIPKLRPLADRVFSTNIWDLSLYENMDAIIDAWLTAS